LRTRDVPCLCTVRCAAILAACPLDRSNDRATSRPLARDNSVHQISRPLSQFTISWYRPLDSAEWRRWVCGRPGIAPWPIAQWLDGRDIRHPDQGQRIRDLRSHCELSGRSHCLPAGAERDRAAQRAVVLQPGRGSCRSSSRAHEPKDCWNRRTLCCVARPAPGNHAR
jgi:hypothetical protein